MYPCSFNSLALLKSSAAALLVLPALLASAADSGSRKFDFGPGTVAPGFTQVGADTMYTRERGFGFETGAALTVLDHGGENPLTCDLITSPQPFYFSVDLPEGNYRVTVTLGDAAAATTTTIKAELRRLMLLRIHTAAGEFITRTFTVNVRNPEIAATDSITAGTVKLKAPRETTQEAWAWDRRLTLEFSDARPAVCAIEIEPVDVPVLFLLGDSTLTDQSREPYSSWGQMLPRWFTPAIAVANHGESGETYRDSIARRRLDKILSVMKSGDTLAMQFGHNDQKQIAQGTGGPFTTYRAEIKTHVDAVRAHGGIPIIVSPMERREFDADGKVVASLADYASAARQSAQELGTAFIDLNAMSVQLYTALGAEKSKAAFVQAADGKMDNTHHNNYGAYQLAKCVLLGLQQTGLPIAKFISPDLLSYDPAHPDDPDTFTLPVSPIHTAIAPLGN